jgi:hypothetical protein
VTPPPTPPPGTDPQLIAGDGGRPSLLPGLVVGGGALAALAALALSRWGGAFQAQDALRLPAGGRIRLVGDPGSFAIDHHGLPPASVTARFRTEQDTITLDEGERT